MTVVVVLAAAVAGARGNSLRRNLQVGRSHAGTSFITASWGAVLWNRMKEGTFALLLFFVCSCCRGFFSIWLRHHPAISRTVARTCQESTPDFQPSLEPHLNSQIRLPVAVILPILLFSILQASIVHTGSEVVTACRQSQPGKELSGLSQITLIFGDVV